MTEHDYHRIHIAYSEHTYSTREADESDAWDNGDDATDRELTGAYIKEPKSSSDDVAVPFKPEPGQKIWLVQAQYSTGRTFGHSENARFEAIDAFLSREKAEAAHKAIFEPQDVNAGFDQKFKSIYLNEAGIERPIFRSWEGYSEFLENNDIIEFTVQA